MCPYSVSVVTHGILNDTPYSVHVWWILTDARPSHIYISFSIADVRCVSWDMTMIGDGGRDVIEVPLV